MFRKSGSQQASDSKTRKGRRWTFDPRRPFDSGAAFAHALSKPFHRLPGRMAFASWRSKNLKRLIHLPPQLWPGDPEAGEQLLDGHFVFWGERHRLEADHWRLTEASQNWHLRFHSFDWLPHLRAVGTTDARDACVALQLSWIDKNRRWNPVGWRLDVCGQRITEWLVLTNFVQSAMTIDGQQAFVHSLAQQAQFISASYPGGLTGAHRFTALKGLLAVATCLDGSGHLRNRALELLERELATQLLDDGAHISRSPTAMASLLRDLVDMRSFMVASDAAQIPGLNQSIYALAAALRTLRMPSGHLVSMNGGPSIDDILNLNRLLARVDDGEPLPRLVQGNYERLTAKRSVLLFDAGLPPQPPHDLDHAAAPGSFEFHLAQQPIIVGCGKTDASAEMSDRLRYTAAYSTVNVADRNHLILRGGGGIKPFDAKVALHRQQNNEFDSLHFELAGGPTLGSGKHIRRLQLAQDGELLEGRDQLIDVDDDKAVLRFHLHPEITARTAGQNVFLRFPKNRGWYFHSEGGDVSLEPSVFIDGHRMRQSQQIIVHLRIINRSAEVTWRLSREGRAARQSLAETN